ncbi:MAG: cation transporter [Burkholderiales bacterium]|nr:cation transporter [Burkholderiales bacterium]
MATHAPAATEGLAQRATWNSVWVNLLLAIVQVIVGVLGRSQALLADGLHSLSDLVSDFVVLAAAKSAAVAADETHPYGHGRFENAASLLLGILMLGVGLGMVWAAVHRLQNPLTIVTVSPLALAVALGTLLVKELLFRYMLAIGQKLRSSMLVANAWHARSDAAASLVAAVGVTANLAGLALADALAAVLVGSMIARMGGKFAYRAITDLTDHALAPDEVQAIEDTLAGTPGVQGVHNLRTRKMADDALVDAHLRVGPDLTVSEGHRIAEAARNAVLSRHRALDALIHIDPEDDAQAEKLLDLPDRPRVLSELEAAAGPILLRARALLHYLDGAIEVDLLFPAGTSEDELVRVRKALAELAARRNWLRDVRVFVGGPEHG